MPTIRCEASGCKATEAGGRLFYQCDHCGRWWCSEHGYEGKRCPGCGKGFLHR